MSKRAIPWIMSLVPLLVKTIIACMAAGGSLSAYTLQNGVEPYDVRGEVERAKAAQGLPSGRPRRARALARGHPRVQKESPWV